MIALAVVLAATAAEPCPPDFDGDGLRDARTPLTRRLCVEAIAARAAVDGDVASAIASLRRLVNSEIPGGDPSMAVAYLTLARLHADAGQLDEAREVLEGCLGTGQARAACVELRGQLDLEAAAVRSVPVTWTFDTPDHGVFHPRAYWDKGDLKLRSDATTTWLAWSTRVDGVREDELVVPLASPSPGPRTLRVRARATTMRAEVEVELVDEEGRRFVPRPASIEIPADGWTDVEVTLRDATPLDGGTARFDPTRLHRLVLRDATGLTGSVGRNEIHFDSLELR
jgi:hypothetical protein